MSSASLIEKNTSQVAPKSYIVKPRCDIYETADSIVIMADLPGVCDNSIDITLEKNILTLSGKVEHFDLENLKLVYSEYRLDGYERVFALSDEVNKENIEASLKNGVLKIVLQKSPVAQARKITVKAH